MLNILILFIIALVCALGFLASLAGKRKVLSTIWFIAMCAASVFCFLEMCVALLTIVCNVIELIVSVFL